MKIFLSLLLLLTSSCLYSEGFLAWEPGTKILSEYRELAGTLYPGQGGSPPTFRSEGGDYLVLLPSEGVEVPPIKNKTTVIMKGIAGTLALPKKPVQHLFWPMEWIIKTKRYAFPSPSAQHWLWLQGLVSEDPIIQTQSD